MADKWLEARLEIEKAGAAAPPPPTPAKPSDYLLDELFGSADAVSPVEKTSKIVDDGAAEIPDPVEAFLYKLNSIAAHVPEIPARRQDGIELEKVGADTWKHHWKNGALVKSELNGVVVTDESSKPLFITDEMAKFLGYGEHNQHDDTGLAGWTPGLSAA